MRRAAKKTAHSGRLQLGNQFLHTEEVNDSLEIVSKHMKAHLGLNIRQAFHGVYVPLKQLKASLAEMAIE